MELFCLIFVQTGSSAMFLWALLSLVISTSNWIRVLHELKKKKKMKSPGKRMETKITPSSGLESVNDKAKQ